MDAVTERVNEFRNSLGLSILAFSKVIGIGQTTLNKQLTSAGVSAATLSMVLKAYPELSAEWLMRGDGTMYHADTRDEVIAALREHIRDLRAERDRMIGEK